MAPSERIIVTQKGRTAGTAEGLRGEARIYPDPCDGLFCVESPFPPERIDLFASDGTLVESRKVDAGSQKETFRLPRRGMLFVVIRGAERMWIGKIVW